MLYIDPVKPAPEGYGVVYSQVLVGVSPWRILVKSALLRKEQGETGEQGNYRGWERIKRWVLRYEPDYEKERVANLVTKHITFLSNKYKPWIKPAILRSLIKKINSIEFGFKR